MSQYIIYGSGKWGRYAYLTLHEEKNLLFFVDRNEKKWGTSLFGRWIYSPEVLRDYPDAVVCVAVENCGGIEEYLHSLGISRVVFYALHPKDDKVPCIIYGSGRTAEEFFEAFRYRFCFAFFVDNDASRLGHRMCGLRVYPPKWMEHFPGMTVVDAMDGDAMPEEILDDVSSRDCMRYRSGGGLLPMFPREDRKEPAVLVDVTIRRKRLPKDGVGRVSDRTFEAMRALGCHVVPVRNMNGTLVTDERTFGPEGNAEERIVEFIKGDILYLLDPTWNDSEDFLSYIQMAQKRGAKVYAIVHDFLPAYYPECFTESISTPFFIWHDMILSHVNGLVCDSRHTADMAERYYREKGVRRDVPLDVHYVHLGTDFSGMVGDTLPRPALEAFFGYAPVFLMVGTLEPRKGHGDSLEAFRILWKKGHDFRLLFLGRDGWLNADIKEKMAACPEGKFLWVRDASDGELQWAYRHAKALIAASLDEGFGLPLIEAAAFGLPIICSDIDVFHEIAGEHAFYFSAKDPAGLSNAVLKWMELTEKPDSGEMNTFSWEDSVKNLMTIFKENVAPYKKLL